MSGVINVYSAVGASLMTRQLVRAIEADARLRLAGSAYSAKELVRDLAAIEKMPDMVLVSNELMGASLPELIDGLVREHHVRVLALISPAAEDAAALSARLLDAGAVYVECLEPDARGRLTELQQHRVVRMVLLLAEVRTMRRSSFDNLRVRRPSEPRRDEGGARDEATPPSPPPRGRGEAAPPPTTPRLPDKSARPDTTTSASEPRAPLRPTTRPQLPRAPWAPRREPIETPRTSGHQAQRHLQVEERRAWGGEVGGARELELREPSFTSDPSRHARDEQRRHSRYDLIGLASSTGGLTALEIVLAGLPHDFPVPLAIVQHIGQGFDHDFVKSLRRHSALGVHLVRDRVRPVAGHVHVSPCGYHLVVNRGPELELSEEPSSIPYRPSATVLFQSMARSLGGRCVGVVLTGMGRDGAEGLIELRRAGGRTVAQDRATSLVFGMPQAAIEVGAIEQVLPIDQIAAALIRLTRG